MKVVTFLILIFGLVNVQAETTENALIDQNKDAHLSYCRALTEVIVDQSKKFRDAVFIEYNKPDSALEYVMSSQTAPDVLNAVKALWSSHNGITLIPEIYEKSLEKVRSNDPDLVTRMEDNKNEFKDSGCQEKNGGCEATHFQCAKSSCCPR